jgi:TRAP-type C4-dicarboxylate transport system permease large subunit
MTVALVGFAALLLLIFMRMPIAFAMGLVGFAGFWFLEGFDISAANATVVIQTATTNYELAVVPMFILMGNLVAKAGLSRELYDASHAFLGHRRGGLAMATIVACGGFSAICGSSLATAATMSKVAMPSMRQYGYADSLATASIASGGTLGILIPPSVILVIYGIMTETSIRDLFAAGFLPGLLGVSFYLVAVQWVVMRNPETGPRADRYGWAARWETLTRVVWTVILFVGVMGGIYTGAFTPNEAAGIGALGAFLIALCRGALTPRAPEGLGPITSITTSLLRGRRPDPAKIGALGRFLGSLIAFWRMDWTAMRSIFTDTVRTTATLFIVLIGALIFSNFVTRAGLPSGLSHLISNTGLHAYFVILIIVLIYIVLGCIFESLSMLLLTIPVFFPVVKTLAGDLGIEPRYILVWFGIVAVVVTEISLITPPIGLNVFVLSGVLHDVKTTTIFKGVTPFWVADIFRLTVLIVAPAISLVLPRLLYG